MVLLAGDKCRHENLYGPGQVFRTVMRHGLVAVAVVLRSRRVIEPPSPRSLMTPTGLALLASPRRPPAIARAVLLAVIAAPANEEDLAALGAPADDKAKRIHGSGRDRQELDVGVEPWDEQLVGPGSGARPEGSRRLPRAFVLFGYGAGVLSQPPHRVQLSAIGRRAGFARFYVVTDTGSTCSLTAAACYPCTSPATPLSTPRTTDGSRCRTRSWSSPIQCTTCEITCRPISAPSRYP